MSFLNKKWIIKNTNKKMTVMAKLLENRGITDAEKLRLFLDGRKADLFDPFLFLEMDKAVERIKKAVSDNEKIMVFGDYDVDGITSTAIVYDFLKRVGADVGYTLPHRENDGYGLKDYFVRRFKDEGVGLLVTVDCGTANFEEVALANKLGIDVLITDHHSIPVKLPKAVAIINPHQEDCPYPNKNISGSGVAYKLVQALAPEYMGDATEEYLEHQLSIAAVGLIGDCMPLIGENRIMVREGLKGLSKGHSPGIKDLLRSAGIDARNISSSDIAFQISPRMNAAGRLDKPDHAFLLLAGDTEKTAILNKLNNERKKMTKQFIDEAVKRIESLSKTPNIIALADKNWKPGLLGLIASGVADRFGRPTIIMKKGEDKYHASMRSVNGFDLTSCLRGEMGDIFSAFGGHALAGGFTLPKENFDVFMKKLEDAGKKKINPDEFVSALEIDCEIQPDELDFDTYGKFIKLEPFGAENPQPTLLVRDATVTDVRPVGKTQEHLQIPLSVGGKLIKTIAFKFGEHADKIDMDKTYDIACSLEVNEWNGNRSVQLKVIDMRESY